MKILIATGLYFPDIGGPATYTKFLERHLPQYGIPFTVVAFTHVRKYPKIIRHIVYIMRLIHAARDVEVIYALDTVSVGVPAWIVSVLLRKKMYLRVPGDYAWEQGQQRFGVTATLDEYLGDTQKPYGVRVLAWLQKKVALHASVVIVPSDYMKRVVTLWGVPAQKIVRIYSALNPHAMTESKESLRGRFGYSGFVVITAARLVPWKGIAALIDAVVLLRKAGLPASLQIIGDGVDEGVLRARASMHGADTYVHFCGRLPKEELLARVTAADAFVLNTSYEGLSHQLLEVMDVGTPLVTTPVGGNVELVTDRVEGLLVPFNDVQELTTRLAELSSDSALRNVLVENARKKVALFREDAVIPHIIKLFS